MFLIESDGNCFTDDFVLLCRFLPEREPFRRSAAPLDTKRSPGEISNPGKLTTTELRLLS